MQHEPRPDDAPEPERRKGTRRLRSLRRLTRPFRRPLIGVPVVLAIAALSVVVALGAPPFDSTKPPEPKRVSVTVDQQVEPAQATESFLDGQKRFDANAVWDSLGDTLQQQLVTNGMTREAYQEQLDSARKSGSSIQDIYYVGGMKLNDGTSVYLYVINVEAPDGSAQVPYMFIVNKQGKIEAVQ